MTKIITVIFTNSVKPKAAAKHELVLFSKPASIMLSQHFIFFVTHKKAQQARVLQYTWLEKFTRDKHFSLLGSFVSYGEKSFVNMFHRYLRKVDCS